jgi:hypothetical protein
MRAPTCRFTSWLTGSKRRVQVRRPALANGPHRSVEQFGVQGKAYGLDLTGLFFAQQFAGSADLHVLGGQGEADAQLAGRLDGFQALYGVGVMAFGCGVSR